MTYLDKIKAESEANGAYDKAERLKKELIMKINKLYSENNDFIYSLEQFLNNYSESYQDYIEQMADSEYDAKYLQ